MYEILDKTGLAPRVTRYVVRAPEVARARRAGQFVIVRPRHDSERIPLTIADAAADTYVDGVRVKRPAVPLRSGAG